MTASDVGYARVQTWVTTVLGPVPATVIITVAWAVLGLVLAQRVTAAAVARAVPAEPAGAGRPGRRRVRRWWMGPTLDPARLSPPRIRLALLRLPPDAPAVVALDTTRLGRWEGWLAGRVVAGRTLPIGWAVIP